MKRHANLMTEGARFRAAARVLIRRWGVALAAGGTLLTPMAIWHWQECRRIRHEHEALEASYEPIRRLNSLNLQLRTTAAKLVGDERLALELAQQKPMTTLLAIVGEAARQSDGALYIQHVLIDVSPPDAEGIRPPDRLQVEAASTLKYDVARFVEALHVAPISEVKITTDVLATTNGVDHKNYAVDCILTAPTQEATASAQ
jgi:hypothetical protein